jgi:hypothetical protein
MLRFTIRDLLWLMVVVGLAVGWASHASNSALLDRPVDMSHELTKKYINMDIQNQQLQRQAWALNRALEKCLTKDQQENLGREYSAIRNRREARY